MLHPLRSIWPASIVLLATNIAAAMLILPTFPQLLLNTCCLVYIGCILSSRLPKNQKGHLLPYNRQLQGDDDVISMKDAKQFPSPNCVPKGLIKPLWAVLFWNPLQVFLV